MTRKLTIVFMGTPDFSVPVLKSIHAAGHRVALVVSQPDRPKGRGRKLAPTPVKRAASDLDLPVAQPDSIKTAAFYDRIASLSPDALVVVAFGQILPESLLKVAPMGAVNIHASLLPKYRGPAPIQRAIINGESETGISTMKMDKGLDTGDILLTSRTDITRHDTATTLHDRLSEMGAELIIETLKKLAEGTLVPTPQDDSLASYAPMLRKFEGRIDWRKSAPAIDAHVRGMTPWPGAFTFMDDKRLKIFKVTPVTSEYKGKPGEVLKSFPDELVIATGRDGCLSIDEIQGASGKRLSIADFLRGTSIPFGTVLS